MNTALRGLYGRYWQEMLLNLEGNLLSNPLLLYINDEAKYQNADLKIMFFGQETNTWEGALGSKDINELLGTYSEFFGEGKCFRYGGQYWNAVKSYIQEFQQMYPNKKIEYVWNNIIKMGKETGKGAPVKSLIGIQKKVFPVIKEEIEILKPDFIIFFTGPYYDQYIIEEWPNITFCDVNDWKKRQLARVEHPLLPDQAYRTYHPNYLYRKGKEYFEQVREEIISNA